MITCLIQVVLNFIWENLLAMLGIVGTLYFYFENKRLKKYDAKRDLQIAESDLLWFDQEFKQKKEDLNKLHNARIRNNGYIVVDDRTQEEKERDFQDSLKIEREYFNERAKKQALVDYNKELKNHSIFWFLKKDKDYSYIWDLKENKFKKFIKKIKKNK